jgi:hypothetical protein
MDVRIVDGEVAHEKYPFAQIFDKAGEFIRVRGTNGGKIWLIKDRLKQVPELEKLVRR